MYLNKKWLVLSLSALFIVACSSDKTETVKPKSVKSDYQVITQSNWPTNINLSKNRIEFVNQFTLGKLAKKWRNDEKIEIAHFGDSHIQPG